MRCSCGTDNPAGMKFCGNCGTALRSRCPRCGLENPPESKFCGECGVALAVARKADVSAKPASSMVEPAVRVRLEQAAADEAGGARETGIALCVAMRGT